MFPSYFPRKTDQLRLRSQHLMMNSTISETGSDSISFFYRNNIKSISSHVNKKLFIKLKMSS